MSRVNERLYFLKKEFYLNLLIVVILAVVLNSIWKVFDILRISREYFLLIIFIYFFTQIIGFWRLSCGYFGKGLILLTIGISSFISFTFRVMLKPVTADDLGMLIGIKYPYNYVCLILYFGTVLYILYRSVQIELKAKDGYRRFLSFNQDIDQQRGLLFLDYNPNKKEIQKIDPVKHQISIFLTVITQVFLVKMAWNSPIQTIISLVSFGLIGIVAFLIGISFFGQMWFEIKMERRIGIKLKPALREPFSLRAFFKQADNSY